MKKALRSRITTDGISVGAGNVEIHNCVNHVYNKKCISVMNLLPLENQPVQIGNEYYRRSVIYGEFL